MHTARWRRQAKQDLLLGSPPLEKLQKIPACRFLNSAWPLTYMLEHCWDPGDMVGPRWTW